MNIKPLIVFLLMASVTACIAQNVPRNKSKPSSVALAIAEQIDKHYNSLHTMTADFTQTEQGMGAVRIERGKIFLKRDGRMRWDYMAPVTKSFILDGKNAWLYLPEERRVRHSKVKQLNDMRSPLRFLLGHAQLAKELEQIKVEDMSAGETKDHIILSGIPKHDLGGDIHHLWIEVNAKMEILQLKMEQNTGEQSEFSFSNVKEDVPLPDSLFRFIPPQGVEIIEEHLSDEYDDSRNNRH